MTRGERRRAGHTSRRRAALLAGLLAAAAVSGSTVAPSAAGADPVLQAPVVESAYAGVGQSAVLTVDGPPSAAVEVDVVSSPPDGDTCSKAMTGPDVTAVASRPLTLDATGHGRISVDGAHLTAGQYLYATATSEGATTPVGNCLLLGAGPPQDVHVTGVTPHSVTASWIPTAGASAQYARLLRRGGQVINATMLSGTATSVTFDGLGASYSYLVSVTSIVHPGEDPPPYGNQIQQFVVPPFSSVDAMTRQQFLDVLGRAPTPTESAQWNLDISLYGRFAKTRIDALLARPEWDGVQSPVIRIYRAALGRWPDTGGLAYWTNRHRSGTSVRMIATVMSQSHEFRTRYGALTNREFVKRIYLNVLNRSADRAGLDYWTRRLDVGAISRGELVLQFSESNENVNETGDAVGAINAYTALLRRVPTAAELAAWGTMTSPPRTELIAAIFGTDEYAARITP